MNKSILTTVILILLVQTISAQSKMLGESFRKVHLTLNEDPEFKVRIDTLQNGVIAITSKGINQYPYYIYEFSPVTDECFAYSIVSNNRQVYNAYLDILQISGVLTEFNTNFIKYEMRSNTDEILEFRLSFPFSRDELLSKRNVFAIQVEKK